MQARKAVGVEGIRAPEEAFRVESLASCCMEASGFRVVGSVELRSGAPKVVNILTAALPRARTKKCGCQVTCQQSLNPKP